MSLTVLTTWCLLVASTGQVDVPFTQSKFNRFVKQQAAELRKDDKPAMTMDQWQHRRAELKAALTAAWGGFPETPCELDPRKLGELQRDGYRIEKIIFQTRPDVWMTANAYVPDKPGRLPAILNVHGHWTGAKQDPVVQSRCIGAAKLGFFVLCVDAFGAGERGIEKNLGEYHGEMVGAMLLPIGLPLSGLQVYENMRAVDYLRTRPEVDPNHIGITGASGGGNQTMYAGAMDERFRCVVPTCSVGNYQAYLNAACCMCEVVPGALTFTEEGDVLGLAANRGLMITSATRDGIQFSVDEARKSFARVQAITSLYKDAIVRHTIIDSEHNYNRPMREAMYGWMSMHLKGQGDGSPIAEPEIQTEDPEELRCFPGESRPDDYMTIPRFALAEARRLIDDVDLPETSGQWNSERQRQLTSLEMVLGESPEPTPLKISAKKSDNGATETVSFDSEPGITLFFNRKATPRAERLAILLDPDAGAIGAASSELASKLRDAGWMVVTPELRATGELAVQKDSLRRAPDHHSAEWSLWIGRPLLGQWTWDVRRTLDAINEHDGALPKHVTIIGNRTAGLVALCAGALDERIGRVVTINSLASYASDTPYIGQRLGLMAPGILKDVGDVAHIAALMAPRQVMIAGGVAGDARPLSHVALKEQFKFTDEIYGLFEPPPEPAFRVIPTDTVVESLR